MHSNRFPMIPYGFYCIPYCFYLIPYRFAYGFQWILHSLHKNSMDSISPYGILMEPNRFPMKANGFPMDSIWIRMHSIWFVHRFHVDSNAVHMDYIWFLIDPIWIPSNCLTNFRMESDGFPMDFHLDSVRFPMDSNRFPVVFTNIVMDSKPWSYTCPYGF